VPRTNCFLKSQAQQYLTIFQNGELRLPPGEDHNFYRDPDQPAALLTDLGDPSQLIP
jgi:hypothetical protein